MSEDERSPESQTDILRKRIVEFIEEATDEVDKSKRRTAVAEALSLVRATSSYNSLKIQYSRDVEDEERSQGQSNVSRLLRIESESQLRLAEMLVANQYSRATALSNPDPIMTHYLTESERILRSSRTDLQTIIDAFIQATGLNVLPGLNPRQPYLLI